MKEQSLLGAEVITNRMSDVMFELEVGQVVVILPVLFRCLVCLQIGAILVFGGGSLSFVWSLDVHGKHLPLFADPFGDVGEGEAFGFEVFAYSWWR